MNAPETLQEIFERKKRARSRYDGLLLSEKMRIALDLHHSLKSTVRIARPVPQTPAPDTLGAIRATRRPPR